MGTSKTGIILWICQISSYWFLAICIAVYVYVWLRYMSDCKVIVITLNSICYLYRLVNRAHRMHSLGAETMLEQRQVMWPRTEHSANIASLLWMNPQELVVYLYQVDIKFHLLAGNDMVHSHAIYRAGMHKNMELKSSTICQLDAVSSRTTFPCERRRMPWCRLKGYVECLLSRSLRVCIMH